MVRPTIAVIGPGSCGCHVAGLAAEVGRLIAERGAVLITGGGSGVMESASRGAHDAGGLVLGILPGADAGDANKWVDVAVPTGMGQLRNGLVVAAAAAVIAVGGEWGTLSEIALARKIGKPVVGLHTWTMENDRGDRGDLLRVESAFDAVNAAFASIAEAE